MPLWCFQLNYHAIIPSGTANSISWHNSLTLHLKGFTSTYCCLYSLIHFRQWVPLQKYDSLKHIHCTSQNKGCGIFFLNTLQTTELNDNSSILSPPPTSQLSPPSHHCHLSPIPLLPHLSPHSCPFCWSRTYLQRTLPEVTSWSWKSHDRYVCNRPKVYL